MNESTDDPETRRADAKPDDAKVPSAASVESPGGADTGADPRPRRRGAGRAVFWLILLLLLAAAGYYGWQQLQQLREQADSAISARDTALDQLTALDRRLQALEAESGKLPALVAQASQAAFDPLTEQSRRLQAQQQIVDDELSGLDERLRRNEQHVQELDQQLSQLGDAREQGRERLLLDQVEYLLIGGAERLRIAGDRTAALDAYQLADRALAGVDPASGGALRETLAEEIRRLQALPIDPRREAGRELDAIEAQLTGLPLARPDTHAESDSRLMRLMSRLVTVTRVDQADADAPLIDPLRRETAIAALHLDFGLARNAVALRDSSAFDSAIRRAGQTINRLYRTDDEAVQAIQQRLTDLSRVELKQPEINLGTTLSALRLLRASNGDIRP